MREIIYQKDFNLYNSPLELGLRALFILNNLKQVGCDLQRLIYYDYLMVHSSDAKGPDSIHPPLPLRTGEILVKREILRVGLLIMQSKELVKTVFESKGIYYTATTISQSFIDYFQSTYSLKIKEHSKWVVETFQHYSDDELDSFIKDNIGTWGTEFSRESFVRGYYEK